MLRKLLSKVQEWMKPQSLPEPTPEPKRPIPIEPNNSHRAIQEFFARHIQRLLNSNQRCSNTFHAGSDSRLGGHGLKSNQAGSSLKAP